MSRDNKFDRIVEALMEKDKLDRIVDGLTPEQRIALWREKCRPTLISLISLWIDETGSSGENVSFGKETAYAIQKFSPNNEILTLDEEYLIDLVDAASKDVDAYDLVERLIVVISSSSAPLPPPLAKIAADKHLGKFPRPSVSGARRATNWVRDILFFKGIEDAEKLQISIYRNEAAREKRYGSSYEPKCGIDLVIEAFKEVTGFGYNYDTVANVWKNRKRNKLKDDALLFLNRRSNRRLDGPEETDS